SSAKGCRSSGSVRPSTRRRAPSPSSRSRSPTKGSSFRSEHDMATEAPDVHIGQVDTDIVVTESIGPLGPAEIRRIVSIVIAHVRAKMQKDKDRERDTKVNKGVFDGGV